MQEFDIKYSLRNIPIHSKHDYNLALLNKIESFIDRMRWKALFTLNKYIRIHEVDGVYHLGTKKYPSAVKELSGFEKDLLGIITIQKKEN